MLVENLSKSRIECFNRCCFQYYLQYIEKIKIPGNFAALIGISIHRVLEIYAKILQRHSNWNIDLEKLLLKKFHKYKPLKALAAGVPTKKAVAEYYEVNKECSFCKFYNGGICGIEQEITNKMSGCPKLLFDNSLKFVLSAINRHTKAFQSNKVWIEHNFDLEIEPGKKIVGIIDLMYEEGNDSIHIIDYKTGSKTQKTFELFDDIQARMYNYAIRILFPQYKNVFLTFDYFVDKPVTICFSDDDIKDTKKFLIEKWNEIEKRETLTRIDPPNYVCKYMCDRVLCDEHWGKLLDAKKR